MQRLSEHERSGAIGILQAGVRVSRDTKIAFRQPFFASEIVTRPLGQLKTVFRNATVVVVAVFTNGLV